MDGWMDDSRLKTSQDENGKDNLKRNENQVTITGIEDANIQTKDRVKTTAGTFVQR